MMGPIAAIESVIFRYFNITSRATRAEYWWWALFQSLALLGCVWADVTKIANTDSPSFNPLEYSSFLLVLLTLIPNVTVAIRRLHDSGHSGLWYLIVFVPFVGGLWFLVLMVLPSERDDNIYGSPRQNGRIWKGKSKGEHNPMQGYAVLDRLNDVPSQEVQAARKQEIRDYYRTRVLQS